jgi:hypothetical protein
MPVEFFDPRLRKWPHRVTWRVLDLLRLGPLRRLHLYQYAAVVLLTFGLWQAALGSAVLWLAQQETPDKPLVDANGMAPSLPLLGVGILLSILGGLLFCRWNWVRRVIVFVTGWLTILFLLFSFEPPPSEPGLRRWFATKLGAATLWWVPALLTLFLINDRVRADFLKTERPEAV